MKRKLGLSLVIIFSGIAIFCGVRGIKLILFLRENGPNESLGKEVGIYLTVSGILTLIILALFYSIPERKKPP